MSRTIKIGIISVAIASTSLFGLPTPAHAAAAGCTIAVNNPHYSKGATGVIFKTRVTCSSTRVVTFFGTLGAGPKVGPHQTRADNSAGRTISAGTTATFYVPRSDLPGVSCSSSLYYSGYGRINVNGQTATDSSGHVKAC